MKLIKNSEVMKMENSKMERAEKMKLLRTQWSETKRKLNAGEIDEVKAILSNHGLNVSPMSYFFVSCQIKGLGLSGLPYLDYKTYKGWQENGFQVKRGEKSVIKGITWIGVKGEDENAEDEFIFPKEYHLFGRHQVEAAMAVAA